MLKEIPNEYMKQFETTMKVGLIATIDDLGLPHMSLISSIQANSSKEIIWGQFIEGFSKKNIKNNPKTGFLIMTLDKKMWRGKATWTHECKEGPEYEMYNNKPLYRYNSYFGIHTVHYMDLVEISKMEKLDIAKIAMGTVETKIAVGAKRNGEALNILTPWAKELFCKMQTLKFLSFVDTDGYPIIIPIIQATAPDDKTIVFSKFPYTQELDKIKKTMKAAVFGLTLEMEDVLVIGTFKGFIHKLGLNYGSIEIEKVYNSMPPKQGWIYPESKIEAVTEF